MQYKYLLILAAGLNVSAAYGDYSVCARHAYLVQESGQVFHTTTRNDERYYYSTYLGPEKILCLLPDPPIDQLLARVNLRNALSDTTVQPIKIILTTAQADDVLRPYALSLGLDPILIHAMIFVESGYNTTAVSPKGAQGLMQLMPSTAERYDIEDPFNPEHNIRGGTMLMSDLLKRYNQDVKLALAAYNAGEGAVDKYKGMPPYKETQNYVKKVLQYYQIAQNSITQ